MSAACQSLPVDTCDPLVAPMAAIRRHGPQQRQPTGFYVVCFVEFCERLAAYVLGSCAVLMLCERYGYERGAALRLAGLVNAASYLGTLPGGFATDRYLGPRRALGLGVSLLTLGYAALTLTTPDALGLSLALLVLGHALHKPSIQAMLARLYEPEDPRLDAAQVVFHLAINVGGVIGAILAGLLVSEHRFRIAFAIAAAATLAARIALLLNRRFLQSHHANRHARSVTESATSATQTWPRIKTIGALTLAMLFYTIGFGQVEGSLYLWAQDHTDRFLLGFEIPAAWFVGLPALLVLLLAPVQLALLPRIQRRGVKTSHLVAWGLVAIALAFVVLIPPSLGSPGQRVSMGWLIVCMALLVVGELLVAPLGMSMVLRLAPPRYVGVVMGTWHISGALGYWLAGELGAAWLR